MLVPRGRATTAAVDYVVLILLLVVVVDGTVVTVADHLLGGAHEYRHTVAPLFRSPFAFRPDGAAISGGHDSLNLAKIGQKNATMSRAEPLARSGAHRRSRGIAPRRSRGEERQ